MAHALPMRNKWIAGLVLCSLFGWADAAAWSSASLQIQSPAAAEALSAHRTHTSAAHHGCCPSLKSSVLVQISALPDPCGGQHRCCFSQAPAFPSSLPVNSERVFAGRTVSVIDCAKSVHSARSELYVCRCCPPLLRPKHGSAELIRSISPFIRC